MKKIFESRKIKNTLFIFLGIIIGGTIIGTFSYVIADNLIKAEQVSYNNVKGETDSQDVQAAIDELYARSARNLLDKIYPVGSIYMSVDSKNPGDLFGGTWVKYSEGSVIVGIKDSDSDFNEITDHGGSKTVTLQLNQIPSHNHRITIDWKFEQHAENAVFIDALGNDSFAISNGVMNNVLGKGTASEGYSYFSGGNGSNDSVQGSTTSHQNMPPYVMAYIWKRTA